MPRLELYDFVVLKSDRRLYGTVERTHYDNHEPLQDILIVAHVPVDNEVLTSFAHSSIPPQGYVFVIFADETQGSSLVAEDQVDLISRSFILGDVVKRERSSMLGAVVNCSESFTLQPIWKQDTRGEPVKLEKVTGRLSHVCDHTCPAQPIPNINHPFPYDLIRDVPGAEIRRTEDAIEADFITADDWIGMVDDVESAVTVLLNDGSIVTVASAADLYMPVTDFDKPIVSLSEFDSVLRRPEVLVAQQGFPNTIPLIPDHYRSGQFVLTNSRNLKLGRWLRGQFDRDVPCQGYIIDARASLLSVRWLACNPMMHTDEGRGAGSPPFRVSPYENLSTFPSRSEIRRNKNVVMHDPSRHPMQVEDRRRSYGHSTLQAQQRRVQAPTFLQIGDFVRFRDPAGAAVKYQGASSRDGVQHGRFDRIPRGYALGFDFNDLRIVSSQQQVVVRWQDGTTSEHISNDLWRPGLFHTEFAPGDMVIAREGMTQRPIQSDMMTVTDPQVPWTPFNEMTYFEKPHEIRPDKVGILQSFDSVERIAQVRWYAHPNIRLVGNGYIMTADSRVGALGHEVEEVSSYEIIMFAGIARSLKDMVVVVPQAPSSKSLDAARALDLTDCAHSGSTTISSIPIRSRAHWLNRTAAEILRGDQSLTPVHNTDYRPSSALDWFGEIVGLGTDGVVTVRINMGDFNRDILIEHDQIVSLIDEASFSDDESLSMSYGDYDTDSPSIDDDLYDSDDASAIMEVVEYEGGKRLDNDSSDENWEDSSDAMSVDSHKHPSEPTASTSDDAQRSGDRDSGLQDASSHQTTVRSSDAIPSAEPRAVKGSAGFSELLSCLSDASPEAFAMLEDDPPPDQFQQTEKKPILNAAFMKRVLKEHKILMTSLPPGQIYVRTYTSRMDLLRCLIIGPPNTPYEYAPFLVDLQLTSQFPIDPPVAHFHSWTGGLGRINPNLYENGKICLSLLGTWQGKDTEVWSPKATLLQLLVSIQALVLVKDPFYNEAGFEDRAESQQYTVESQRYNEDSFLVARAFVKHALQHPVSGLHDVLAWNYLTHGEIEGLLSVVLKRSRNLIQLCDNNHNTTTTLDQDKLMDGNGDTSDQDKAFLKRLSKGGLVMLRRTIKALEEMASQLPPTSSTDDIVMVD